MREARLLKLADLMNMCPPRSVYIETKQTLRPAFFMGVHDWAKCGIDYEYPDRYEVNLITPAKIAKQWKWRLNNVTWRVWDGEPTREQRAEEKWDG